MKNKYNKIILNDVFSEQITGEWGTECLNGEKGTKILRTTNFTNDGIINYSEVVERKIDESKIKNKHLKHGDIILEKSGGSDNQPVGRVVYFDNRKKDIYLCNNFTQVLRTDNTKAISKYVFYFMFNYHKQGFTSLLQNKTTGIRNLQVKKYLDTQIFLPPMEEQKKIVDVLDKLNNIIEKRKKQLEKLDELIKSKFIEMFGDPVTNPKKWIVDNLIKVAPIEHFKIKNKIDKIWLLNLDAIESNTGRIIYKEYISFDDISSSTCFFNNEVVLYSKLRPYLNKVVIPNELGVATSELLPLKPNISKLNKIFFAYLLRTANFVSFISNKVAGAKMPRVSMKDFYSFEVILPPLNLQNKFAEFVKTVGKQKSLINKSLEKLELTLKSLIQEYFE